MTNQERADKIALIFSADIKRVVMGESVPPGNVGMGPRLIKEALDAAEQRGWALGAAQRGGVS